MSVEIMNVPKERLFEVWHSLTPYLKDLEGITKGRMDVDDVLMDALSGDSKIWLIYSPSKRQTYAVAVTKVIQYSKTKSVLMEFCSGTDRHLWFAKAESSLVEYAKSVGADMVEALGRKGFIKLLGDDWASEHVILTKRI